MTSSSRAWLYGKLLVTLLAQKIDPHRSQHFPLRLHTLGAGSSAVRRENLASGFTRSSKLSNQTSLWNRRSIRGIRLRRLLQSGRASDYSNWRNGMPRESAFGTGRPAVWQKLTSVPRLGPCPRHL